MKFEYEYDYGSSQSYVTLCAINAQWFGFFCRHNFSVPDSITHLFESLSYSIAMEKQHRELIKQDLLKLAYLTYDVEPVVDKLYERNVINKWMKDYIMDSTLNNVSKSVRLYQLIQGRGPLAFSALCKTLNETKQIDARNVLIIKKNMKTDHIESSMRNNNMNSADEPYVKIHPGGKRMDIDNGISSSDVYPMGSNPKGHAFILNINKTVGRDERCGSNVDFVNLNKLFKGLGYFVESKVDLTKDETIEAVDEFINNCQGKKIDSIVVFIMSHGEAGKDDTRSSDILTSDGNNINTDWLIEKFGSDKISKSIPKLFFIQACRGKNSDFGRSPTSVLNDNEVLQNDSSSIGTIVNRRYENVFIAYATVPGYNAKRHPVNGSWFVQTLCEVIRNNAFMYDIHSMMRLVDLEIESLNCLIHGFQTVEWTYRGFNKKFYFNPGLYDDNTINNISNDTQVNPVDTEN